MDETRRAREARLAAVALAGGATAAAFLLLSALTYRVLAEATVARDGSLAHALVVISYLAGGPGIAVPLALPIGCASILALRDGQLPRWSGWIGTVAVAACIGSASAMVGPMNNTSVTYGILLLAGSMTPATIRNNARVAREVVIAEVRIEGGELVLHLTASEKVESVHGDLSVPLSAVRSIEVIDDAHGAAGGRPLG